MKSTLKAPGTKCLKLRYDQMLFHFCFNFAFIFNLRRYITALVAFQAGIASGVGTVQITVVPGALYAAASTASNDIVRGRGLYSSTSQLTLSRFCH